MLDLNDLQYLPDTEKSRYMMMERLFANPGWDYVMQLAQSDFDAAKARVISAQTWDQNRVAFGAMQAFYSLLNLRDQIEAEFEQLAAKAKAEKVEQEEDDFE